MGNLKVGEIIEVKRGAGKPWQRAMVMGVRIEHEPSEIVLVDVSLYDAETVVEGEITIPLGDSIRQLAI